MMFRSGAKVVLYLPLEDAQLTEPAGVGQGPVALHILKGVGGGARAHRDVPAQVAAGVPSGDGDLVAAAAQAREGGGEGTAAGVPGKGTAWPSTVRDIRSADRAFWEASVIRAVTLVPDSDRATVGAVLSHPLSLARTNWFSHRAPAASGEGEPLEGGRPVGHRGGDFLPPGEVQGGQGLAHRGAVFVGEGGGERGPRSVAVDPQGRRTGRAG